MESLVDQLRSTYSGKRVLITGHNGFKGSWLVALLEYLGAEIHGISLEISDNSPFKEFHKQNNHSSYIIDIRNFAIYILAVAIKLGIEPDNPRVRCQVLWPMQEYSGVTGARCWCNARIQQPLSLV